MISSGASTALFMQVPTAALNGRRRLIWCSLSCASRQRCSGAAGSSLQWTLYVPYSDCIAHCRVLNINAACGRVSCVVCDCRYGVLRSVRCVVGQVDGRGPGRCFQRINQSKKSYGRVNAHLRSSLLLSTQTHDTFSTGSTVYFESSPQRSVC
jgi:hypothetical protein